MKLALEIIKKNWISLVCLLIALIALILPFYPLSGMFAKQEQDLDRRKTLDVNLENLLHMQRKLPTIDPDSTTQLKLADFPNRQTIDKGHEVVNQVQTESLNMLDAAVQINQHNVLAPDVLPNPSDTAEINFRVLYQATMPSHLRDDILQAGTPPTHAQVDKRKEEIWNTEYASRRIFLAPDQPDTNTDTQLHTEFDHEVENLGQRMNLEAAQKHKVYLDPDALTIDPHLMGGETPTPAEVWFAQTGLWIQQDVAEAIRSVNAKSQSIQDAPVKRLIRLEVPDHMMLSPRLVVGAREQIPADLIDPDSAVPKVRSIGPTERACNGLYDVYHFQLSMIVDAAQIPQVLAELERNRLLTVCQTNVNSVDALLDARRGYLYGSPPVARLDLECEEIFLRKWTAPLMPDSIRVMLGLPRIPSGGETAGPGSVP